VTQEWAKEKSDQAKKRALLQNTDSMPGSAPGRRRMTVSLPKRNGKPQGRAALNNEAALQRTDQRKRRT